MDLEVISDASKLEDETFCPHFAAIEAVAHLLPKQWYKEWELDFLLRECLTRYLEFERTRFPGHKNLPC